MRAERRNTTLENETLTAEQLVPPAPVSTASDIGDAGPVTKHETSDVPTGSALRELVETALDDAKAEEVVTIDLTGKSAIADAMLIASGRSDRHVNAVADRVLRTLKDNGLGSVPAEGLDACDWVLIDAGDVIVHIFRPEVRDFYNLEKMWQANLTGDTEAGAADPLDDRSGTA